MHILDFKNSKTWPIKQALSQMNSWQSRGWNVNCGKAWEYLPRLCKRMLGTLLLKTLPLKIVLPAPMIVLFRLHLRHVLLHKLACAPCYIFAQMFEESCFCINPIGSNIKQHPRKRPCLKQFQTRLLRFRRDKKVLISNAGTANCTRRSARRPMLSRSGHPIDVGLRHTPQR